MTLNKELLQDKRLSSSAKLLYMSIIQLSANDYKCCFASSDYLIDYFATNKKTLARWYGELTNHNYIKRERRKIDGKTKWVSVPTTQSITPTPKPKPIKPTKHPRVLDAPDWLNKPRESATGLTQEQQSKVNELNKILKNIGA